MKIQLNKICFGLPSKAFFIDYTVSQKRQLPVVKEFIVRLLHSLESANIQTLRNFFGFTDKEIQAVLDDLLEESLIKWDEDKVALSHYALNSFVEVDGNMLPRFFEVAEKTDTVHFELHDFRILPNIIKRGNPGNLNITLSLSDDCYKDLNQKAQSSFDSHFQQFREIVKQEDIFSDRQELYKINQVSSKYDLLIPVEVEYYIEINEPSVLKMGYESNLIDEWDNSKTLFTTMDKMVTNALQKKSGSSFIEYANATNDPILSNYWNDSSQTLEYDLLVNNYNNQSANIGNDTVLIIGNFYTDFNSDYILDKIKERYEKIENFKNSGLIWFTSTQNISWGKSSALSNFLSKIKFLFDKKLNTSESVLVMSCKSKQEAYELNKLYGRLDAKLLGCTNLYAGEKGEVLLIPNVMVACLYHSPIDDTRSISFPVGYISFNKKTINDISNKISKWGYSQNNFNNYMDKKDTKENDGIFERLFIPIINQSIE
ncbi:hypothetical protein STW0522CIT19_12490 [Citrobacter freundii]|nr:hypothetical protein STW0522CIT01_12490 [Citrobacter freundii]BBV34774.1 hypothetical protein STW0522CIT19_12490 [Citrobacter freundii]